MFILGGWDSHRIYDPNTALSPQNHALHGPSRGLGTSGGLDELRPQADAVPLGLHQLAVDHQQMGI